MSLNNVGVQTAIALTFAIAVTYLIFDYFYNVYYATLQNSTVYNLINTIYRKLTNKKESATMENTIETKDTVIYNRNFDSAEIAEYLTVIAAIHPLHVALTVARENMTIRNYDKGSRMYQAIRRINKVCEQHNIDVMPVIEFLCNEYDKDSKAFGYTGEQDKQGKYILGKYALALKSESDTESWLRVNGYIKTQPMDIATMPHKKGLDKIQEIHNRLMGKGIIQPMTQTPAMPAQTANDESLYPESFTAYGNTYVKSSKGMLKDGSIKYVSPKGESNKAINGYGNLKNSVIPINRVNFTITDTPFQGKNLNLRYADNGNVTQTPVMPAQTVNGNVEQTPTMPAQTDNVDSRIGALEQKLDLLLTAMLASNNKS